MNAGDSDMRVPPPPTMSGDLQSYTFIRNFVEIIVDRLSEVLPDLMKEAIEQIDTFQPDRNQRPKENGALQIKGIDPHKLYPVSFLEERWDYSKSAVYRISNVQLPRVDWNGGEIRYRGRDILEYEGVDVDSRLNDRQSNPRDNSSDRSPHRSKSNGHKTSRNGEENDGRPYEDDLPEL